MWCMCSFFCGFVSCLFAVFLCMFGLFVLFEYERFGVFVSVCAWYVCGVCVIVCVCVCVCAFFRWCVISCTGCVCLVCMCLVRCV